MKECKGLIGRIFGHKFEPMIVKYTPARGLNLQGCMLSDLVDSMAEKEYKVVCQRCGKEKE